MIQETPRETVERTRGIIEEIFQSSLNSGSLTMSDSSFGGDIAYVEIRLDLLNESEIQKIPERIYSHLKEYREARQKEIDFENKNN